MNQKIIETAKRILKLDKEAQSGPWNTGPTTAAGDVWIYRQGSPLMEPLHFIRRMFRLRSDSQKQWEPGETFEAKDDRFWQQKQKDARFIVEARTAVPILAKAILDLANSLEAGGGER